MEKEEVLARSRAENKNKDYYELEVLAQAGQTTAVVMTCLAGIFLVLQVSYGGGLNYGLYALVAAGNMTMDWVKWAKLHRRREFVMAILWTAFSLALSAAHIYNLAAM